MNGSAAIGFVIAGGLLVLVTGAAPKAGLALASVIALGVVLSHSQEITTMIGTYTASLGK